MTADDTSREALVERVENLLMDERDKYPRVHNDAPSADLAEAVVDAVVMPLVQERDAARAEALRVDEANTRMGLALDAARHQASAALDVSTAEYRIAWLIEVDADSPMHAAEQALAIQRDPESVATSFVVSSMDGKNSWLVDLDEGTVEPDPGNEEGE